MQSPKKSKSTRRPCPIDINCELVAAERGKVCPNRDYCEHIAAPWRLPFVISRLQDGTRVMIVTTASYSMEGEGIAVAQNIAGWANAAYLPFHYVNFSDMPKPVLFVRTFGVNHQNSGWAESKPLGINYWRWAAVRIGMSYLEFYEKDFYWSEYWDFQAVVETPTPNHPHCILASNY